MTTTGLVVADMDGDGYRDIVTSSGNDTKKEPVVVYFNRTQGSDAASVSHWSQTARTREAFHMEIAAGDVDGDGCPDLAAAIAMRVWPFGYGHPVVYMSKRRPDGTCEPFGGELWAPRDSEDAVPDVRSLLDLARSVALGDADADGDLDLAVVLWGDSILGGRAVRIYENQGGQLAEEPWTSNDDFKGAGDLEFGDVNGDGFLDLAVAARKSSGVFFGAPHAAATGSAAFQSEVGWSAPPEDESRLAGISIELEGRHVAIAYGCPIFRCKRPCPGRVDVHGLAPFDNVRSWPLGYASHLRYAQLWGDARQELIASRWETDTECPAGELRFIDEASPVTATTLVARAVTQSVHTADLARRHVETRCLALEIRRPQSVISLPESNVERILGVWRNGEQLSSSAAEPRARRYAADGDNGWISFGEALKEGDEVIVTYERSERPDLIAVNSDHGGVSVFYNRR